MKYSLFILLMFCLLGCTRPDSTVRLLKAQGYEDIKITGYSFLSCSEDDEYHTGFTAKRNGKVVSGTVCEGFFFKDATIRFKT